MFTLLVSIKVEHIWCGELRSYLYKRFALHEFVHVFPGLVVREGNVQITLSDRIVWNNDANEYEVLNIEDVTDVRERTDELVKAGWSLEKTTLPQNGKHPVEEALESLLRQQNFCVITGYEPDE